MTTASLALVLYGIYITLAFGARTYVHFLRTGQSGWNGVSGRKGSPEWFAGVLFGVALVVGVSAPVLDLLALVPRIGLLDTRAVHGLGLVLYGGGFVGTLLAQWSMGKSWRIGVKAGELTELVTSGPFRWVRNPIFTAMLPTALGLVALVPNWVGLGGCLGLLMAFELQVRVVEEPHLLRTHGQQYRIYARRVGRFLPWLGRMRDAPR